MCRAETAITIKQNKQKIQQEKRESADVQMEKGEIR